MATVFATAPLGTMARLFSEEEVAKHRSAFNCWLVLGEHGAKKVYDVTAFLEDHPGGPDVLLDLAGQDAEDEFKDVGHSKAARAMLEELYIGDLKEDGDRRAVREANKMHRHSLLTHSEMQQRASTSRLSKWSQRFVSVAVAFAVCAMVAAWLVPSSWDHIDFLWQKLQNATVH